MSLTAYGCGFDFKQSAVIYMLYLIYYRSARCHSEFNWGILGVDSNVSLQPNMPSETTAVFRTLIFSIFYLVLSIFLVITCILAFGESFFENPHFLSDNWISNSGTPTHWKVKALGVLVVFCPIHHRFCSNNYVGFNDVWFLSLRLLFNTERQWPYQNSGNP